MGYTLYILVDDSLKQFYETKMVQHNNQTEYADSGFDLICPETITVEETCFLDFKIKTAMYKDDKPSAYYLYPRSSISKTPFRLSNSVGIMDAGYRGNVGAYFDCKSPSQIVFGQRLVQICSPTLEPFQIILTDSLTVTQRNTNGFGSSGK
jgi:dUTP pyrophosphatase